MLFVIAEGYLPMPLPTLTDWEPTRDALHQAALVISAIKKLGVQRDEHFFHHLAMQANPHGLTSGITTFGVFSLDFTAQAVSYQPSSGQKNRIPLAGHNQKTLLDALLRTVRESGFTVEVDRSQLNQQTPFDINPEWASGYAHILFTMVTALNQARVSLPPQSTNVVVFPHHFDASFLWFNGEAKSEQQPHVNFGFSPGDSTINRPYFYAYAWGGKAYLNIPVDPPLMHDHRFKAGVMIPYDEVIRDSSDPIGVITGAVSAIRAAVESQLWG
jgi:hypothetical protein